VAHETKGFEGSTGQGGGEGLPWGSRGMARERGSVPAKMGGLSEGVSLAFARKTSD